MELQLDHVHYHNPDIATFFWRAPEHVAWRAGQYGVFYLPHDPFDKRGPERFFTISAAPSEGIVAFTTRRTESTFKKQLFCLKRGEKIYLQSIGGDFVIQDPFQRHLFIAGGIGITPFRSILQEATISDNPVRADVIYITSNTTPLFDQELSAVDPAFVSMQFLPARDNLSTAISSLPHITDPAVPIYISGPISMVDETEALLLRLGATESQLHYDYFEYDWA